MRDKQTDTDSRRQDRQQNIKIKRIENERSTVRQR